MKKSIFIIVLVLLASCKKEVKQTSLTKDSIEQYTSIQQKDTLQIIGNNIWVRQTPKTGKVVFKLNDGVICGVLEKGIKDTIRQQIDFWYKINSNNQKGWVFGSQTSKSEKYFLLDDFKPFLNKFLTNSFYGKNTDSLLRYKLPVIYKYINPKIGFTRFHNPGITCIPQEYDDYNYDNKNHLKSVLEIYPNKEIKNGFCDESTSKDGVYYQKIKQLPKYPVFIATKDDYIMKSIPLPKEYKNAPIKEVLILHKKWIIKHLYFIKADNKWWLVLSNDCDCSA